MKETVAFLYQNIVHPFGKITAHLGSSIEGKRYLKYFNERSIKRGFIKLKKFNCAIIDTKQFEDQDAYLKTVKGKNSADYFARRCEKMNYSFKKFNPNEKIDEIHMINTSSSERQGRAMDASYLTKKENWPADDINVWYGVFDENNELVAYLWTVCMDELSLMNRILGHSEHLKNNIMYFLVVSFVKKVIVEKKHELIMYDTFGREQNGLVLFKKRIGFKPYTVNFKA